MCGYRYRYGLTLDPVERRALAAETEQGNLEKKKKESTANAEPTAETGMGGEATRGRWQQAGKKKKRGTGYWHQKGRQEGTRRGDGRKRCVT